MNKASSNTYYYSYNGTTFTQFGGTFALKWGGYRGDYIGIYNYNNTSESGYIDVNWFHYTFAGPTVTTAVINSQKSNSVEQGNNGFRVQCIAGSNGRTIIKLPDNLRSNAQVTMCDIAGKSIPFAREPSGAYISVNHVSTGMAFLKIANGQKAAIVKVFLK